VIHSIFPAADVRAGKPRPPTRHASIFLGTKPLVLPVRYFGFTPLADLEERYFGKIVAIDTDRGGIVGVGDTILEAYEEAKKKRGKINLTLGE